MASVAHIIRRRRRRRTRRKAAQSTKRNWVALVALIVFGVAAGALSIIIGTIANAYLDALDVLSGDPQATIFREAAVGATEIYDSQGETLLFSVQDPLGDEREWIELETLPEYIGAATVLAEDPLYYRRAGFDLITAADTLWDNALNGPLTADSSLTGRLVRSVLVPDRDFVTIEERGTEIALIAEVNRRYSQQDILEWHLNTNYYGNEAYGIEAAAQVYLGKAATDLTLDEAVLLAAIPTAPRFNPVDNEVAARDRQAALLQQMLSAEIISQTDFAEAVNTQTVIRPDGGQTPLVAPEFALYARRQAEVILNAQGLDGAELVSRGGLRVTTTLDLELYFQAECTLRAHLNRLTNTNNETAAPVNALNGAECVGASYLPRVTFSGDAPPTEGALVVLDADTGAIRAMVGAGTQAEHEAGPVLRPFIYLAGMLNDSPNYNPASMLLDVPDDFPGTVDGLIYLPQNPDGQFRGPLSLRDAMGAGLVMPAVRVANALEINSILRDYVYPLGITSLSDTIYDISLLERGGTVSLLEVANAYLTFATLGDVYDIRRVLPAGTLDTRLPVAIQQIEDDAGTVLWQYDADAVAVSRVSLLSPQAAFVVNDVLADHSTRWGTVGQDSPLEMTRPVAVINGVTGREGTSWTVGYTPRLLAGVQVGRTGEVQTSLSGFETVGAAPVWRAVMDYIYDRDGLRNEDWSQPEGVVTAQVCRISGGLATEACAGETRTEVFLSPNTLPDEDQYWQLVEINTENNRLATTNTPTAFKRLETYFVPPAGALDWWRARNLPLPPEEADTSSRPDFANNAAILQPILGDIIGGETVEVRGSMDATNMEDYQISYGPGTNPSTWINLTERVTTYEPGTVLASWDTRGLDGTYTLRLLVRLTDGTIDDAYVQVTIDNVRPTIILRAGEVGQVFRWPEDEVIPLVAEVTDNFRVDRVEFYHNGQFVGARREAPFAYQHIIARPDTTETFQAVVFDAVGNQTESQTIQVDVLRSGG